MKELGRNAGELRINILVIEKGTHLQPHTSILLEQKEGTQKRSASLKDMLP